MISRGEKDGCLSIAEKGDGILRLLLYLLLMAALLFALPVTAYADKTITGLGTGTIGNPAAPASATSPWSGSYVYYGKYDNNPVKYRVLTNSTTLYGGTTMLLDCDSVLYKSEFGGNNTWAGSTVYNGLNGDSFLTKDGNFTDAEKNAIASSTRASHSLVAGEGDTQVTSWTKGTFENYVALTGEKIFLLDAEEASTNSYGYSTTNEYAANRLKTGVAGWWWLRSAVYGNNFVLVAGVVLDGAVVEKNVANSI